MKSIALVLLTTLLWSLPARADSQQLAPVKLDVTQLDRDIKHSRIRRDIGIAMTVPGLVSAILGTVILVHGLKKLDPNYGTDGVEDGAGATVGILGLALAIPGTVLWITGQDNMDTLKWRREQSLTPFVSSLPRGQGAVAGVRLTF